MHYRRFGKTDWQVSEVGFGTWAMGGNMWGPTNDKLSRQALNLALDQGVNFFDTATVYGNGHSEQMIGEVVRTRKLRDKVFIATKVPPKDYHWPARAGSKAEKIFPAAWIREMTETSLRNLASNYVDLQQLHVWSPVWLESEEWLNELSKLKAEGKIRSFGISVNDHQPESAVALVKTGLIDSVQVIYNIFDQAPAEALLPACQEQRVAVIVRVPFDEGGLTGTLTPDSTFKKDWRRFYFKESRLLETCQRVEKLKTLLNGMVKTLPDLALKFCLAHPAVTTVIPGMRRPEHVEANCTVSNGKNLSVQLLTQLKKHVWQRNFYPVWEEEEDI